MSKKRKSKVEPEAKAKADQPEAEVASFHRALVEKPAPEESAQAEDPEPKSSSGYKVAEGRSVSTGNTIIGEGKPIKPSDLCKDERVAESNFARLMDSGLIVEA